MLTVAETTELHDLRQRCDLMHDALGSVAARSAELRIPLTSILGFNQLLDSEAFGSLTERQRRYVENIQANGTHLLGLLDEVLDLAGAARCRDTEVTW